MSARYERWLIARGNVLAPSWEALISLVTKMREEKWLVGKGKARHRIVETKQQAVYKNIDERYVPERAIMAMARRVSSRRGWLGGKVDFAVAEYHTSTSVLSCAATPSAGKNCEKPVSRAASAQAGSSNRPSTVMPASRRGVTTVSWPSRPWKTAPA